MKTEKRYAIRSFGGSINGVSTNGAKLYEAQLSNGMWIALGADNDAEANERAAKIAESLGQSIDPRGVRQEGKTP